MDRMEAARCWIAQTYPSAVLAVIGGSSVGGACSAYSDVDVFVCADTFTQAMWKTVRVCGIVYEVWEVPVAAVSELFADGVTEANPTLQRIVCEGMIVQERAPEGAHIVAQARADWEEGPWVWTDAERDEARYVLTTVCDDVRTSTHAVSCALLIACATERAIALWMRMHRRWVATGKHVWYDFHQSFPEHAAVVERVCARAFAQPLDARAEWLDAIGALIDVAGGWMREGYVAVRDHGSAGDR